MMDKGIFIFLSILSNERQSYYHCLNDRHYALRNFIRQWNKFENIMEKVTPYS